MSTPNIPNPFHSGEIEAQSRAGAGDVAQWAGGFIREYLTEQHRTFHTAQPFLVLAGSDTKGNIWTTLIEGEDGFARSPNATQMTLSTELDSTDPLAENINVGTPIGVLGIELASRRRNRFSGFIRPNSEGYSIDVSQAFGNCPQYIKPRHWIRAERASTVEAFESAALNDAHKQLIARSDTMFIGSGQLLGENTKSQGFDASHRGGAPGFVKVVDNTHVQIPDYAGNNFFNTLGNLLIDSRIGLLFVDFQSGSLLQISGKASIEWSAKNTADPGALRSIDVEIKSVIYRPQAVSLRWDQQQQTSTQLLLVNREEESADITSFYFSSVHGERLKPFKPGQHLPIELQLPGQVGASMRTYSLSGSSKTDGVYRISVKREDDGLVSRYLHDEFQQGSLLSAQVPAGDFVIPCSDCPLVLISAGVGQTPLLAMLHHAAGQDRPVWFVHSASNGHHHALRKEVDYLVKNNINLKQIIHYSQPSAEDVIGEDYDVKGRITASHILELNAGAQAHYLLCGPSEFMSHINAGLEGAAIPAEKIHFESF